jgi:hypothetical protein
MELFFGVAEHENVRANSSLVFGPRSHAEVIAWAQQKLRENMRVSKVYITSLEATAERSAPPIMVTPYSPGNVAEEKFDADPIAT